MITFRGEDALAVVAEHTTAAAITLAAWPSFSGLSIESTPMPAMQQRHYGMHSWTSTEMEFDIVLVSDSVDDVLRATEALARLLSPSHGPGRLELDIRPGWYWTAAATGGISWERMGWNRAIGYQLRGAVALGTFGDAAARLVNGREIELPVGVADTVETTGNLVSTPSLQITGEISAEQIVTVAIGDFEAEISGPLAADQIARLDWENMDLGVWEGGEKIASLVPRIDTLRRPELRPGEPISVTVDAPSGGTLSDATIYPNDRRG